MSQYDELRALDKALGLPYELCGGAYEFSTGAPCYEIKGVLPDGSIDEHYTILFHDTSDCDEGEDGRFVEWMRNIVKLRNALPDLLEELDALRSRVSVPYNPTCELCGAECNGLGCNPGLWPVCYGKPDNTGKAHFACLTCVSDRLADNDALRATVAAQGKVVEAAREVASTIAPEDIPELLDALAALEVK